MRKEIIIILISLLYFGRLVSFAQETLKTILPYHITVSYDKTTNLIFPYSIKSVDRGSSAVLAQKAKDVENILQLKAGEESFKETNVTVITSDGHFYSFVVSYASSATVLNYSLGKDSGATAVLTNQFLSETSMQITANMIRQKPRSLRKWMQVEDIKLSLDNLFIKDDLVWIRLSIQNNSAIPFTPSYARFSMQDAKRVKRTAVQENQLVPVYNTPFEKIKASAKLTYVFAFKLFTIPTTKKLVIQMGEEEGSRLLVLKLSHRIMHKIEAL